MPRRRILRPDEIRQQMERKGDVVGLQLMDEFFELMREWGNRGPDFDKRNKDWERRHRIWKSGNAPEGGNA